MRVPQPYRELLLSPQEPGQIYRQCLETLQREGRQADYALTEALVYGCEVRYALEVLERGRPQRLYNFGDLDGRGSELLWRVLDPLPQRRVAFVGCGPYPITALLVRERYPDCQVTCIDNHLVAYLLAQAVLQKLDAGVEVVWAEADQVDYSGYTAVVIAAMVGGKPALVERVLKQTTAQLIVRGHPGCQHERVHSLESGFSPSGSLDFSSD